MTIVKKCLLLNISYLWVMTFEFWTKEHLERGTLVNRWFLLVDITGLLAELIGGDRVNIDTLVEYSLVFNIEVVIFLMYTQVHFDVYISTLVQYSILMNIEAAAAALSALSRLRSFSSPWRSSAGDVVILVIMNDPWSDL